MKLNVIRINAVETIFLKKIEDKTRVDHEVDGYDVIRNQFMIEPITRKVVKAQRVSRMTDNSV